MCHFNAGIQLTVEYLQNKSTKWHPAEVPQSPATGSLNLGK